ncbi:MAG: alpha/beta hydrolase [Granulosicoccus sp.]
MKQPHRLNLKRRTDGKTGQVGGHRDELIVLVHGIWMQGFMMRILGQMLTREGYRTHQVSYDFLGRSPEENAGQLFKEITGLQAKTIHLVGHSLGGIVILHLLKRHPEVEIGKVVLLGSPVRGSSVAKRLHANQLLRPLLGRSIERGLLGGAPNFDGQRPLGVITGSGQYGISSLLYPTGEDSDGVVTLSETLLDNVTDRTTVPLSHSTMIFSRQCAKLVAQFLQHGRFAG